MTELWWEHMTSKYGEFTAYTPCPQGIHIYKILSIMITYVTTTHDTPFHIIEPLYREAAIKPASLYSGEVMRCFNALL